MRKRTSVSMRCISVQLFFMCLYNPFYQYFLDRWHDPALPEYELETDELIYRDKAGNEVRREKFELPALAQA